MIFAILIVQSNPVVKMIAKVLVKTALLVALVVITDRLNKMDD
jgi:hypothetical protein